jgi:hypothetical protein
MKAEIKYPQDGIGMPSIIEQVNWDESNVSFYKWYGLTVNEIAIMDETVAIFKVKPKTK